MADNFDGLSVLVASLCIVICTLAWNYFAPSKYRLSFDEAEKIAIYVLAVALVFLAIYITF
jgi:hypothetical protein